MSGPGGTDRSRASLEDLFATLRKQNSELKSPDAEPSETSIFNQQQFQQNHSRASSHSGNPNPVSFSFGSFGHAAPQSTAHLSGYHSASISSPVESPIPIGRPPRHDSAVLSPALSAPAVSSPTPNAGLAASDRTTNLLNLLKFAQPTSGARPTPVTAVSQPQVETSVPRDTNGGTRDVTPRENQTPQEHGISASDLVASIMGKAGTPGARASPAPSVGLPKTEIQGEPTETSPSSATQPRDVLLKLLSRHKPLQSPTPPARQGSASGGTPPNRVLDADAITEGLSHDSAGASLDKNQATGINDKPDMPQKSEALATHHSDEPAQKPYAPMAASPRERTPRAESSRAVVAPTYNILKRPGTATPEHVGSETHKRKSKESSPAAEHASSRRKLASSSDRLSSTRSSPRPAPLADAPGPSKAVTSLGGTDKAPETVSEALKEVAEKVDRQVENALANVNGKIDIDIKKEPTPPGNGHLRDIERKIESVAADIIQESDEADGKDGLEEARATAAASETLDAPPQVVNEPTGDSWESEDGEDSPAKDEEERIVRVYNFPMRPYASITVKPAPAHAIVSFRRESILDIARLKKEFDQIDRTLATASKQYIIYAMVKHGGFRIIRQDDGRDHQVFAKSGDRIFNVISATASSGESSFEGEAAFGTGVSGSVYWVGLSGPEKVFWRDEEVESHGFVLPPIPGHGDSVSKGQLKTRAKKSARHPEYFAIGRGKAIYIIWPAVAQHPKYLQNKKERIVDVDKYISGRSLKISTGKAGKDFAFSEDDTTIATLDKAGQLKIWDIRKLVDEANGSIQETGPSKITPIEIKTPLMELATNPPSEKPWPSSVLFVDKHRPYMKGTASRYLILGMKQNHILQLWDLALGKPVQEVNFPHDNEADGICSISYHSSSGIIVVGHPTRNSIYFLTLSAPKYNLPPLSQATYVERLVQKDQALAKVDVTAIITGIREYTLGSMGQLRTVDILPQPSSVSDDGESPVLFELYVMHSKGVSCISVRAEDLGWSKESRILHPADAVKEELITLSALREPEPMPSTEETHAVSENQQEAISSTITGTKAPVREIAKKSATAQGRTSELPSSKGLSATVPSSQKSEPTRVILSNGAHEQGSTTVEKAERKKKKRAGVIDLPWRAKDEKSAQNTNSLPSLSYSQASQQVKASESPTRNDTTVSQGAKDRFAAVQEAQTSPTKTGPSTPALVDTSSINNSTSGNGLGKEAGEIEKKISDDFAKMVSAEIKELRRQITEDRRIHQAAFDTKLEAVLRLVSSILTDNTEKALARIIEANINKSVVPAIKEMTTKVLDQALSETLREQTHRTVSRELKKGLPEGIRQALESPRILQDMSDLVANKVATHVESEFAAVVHSTISPVFKEFTLNTVKKMGADLEGRVVEQIGRLEERHRSDTQKIDALQDATRSLMQMVSRMAAAQADFQQEILRAQRLSTQSGDTRQPDLGGVRTSRTQIGSVPVQPPSGRSASINAGNVRPTSISAAQVQPSPAPPVPVQSASVLPAALQSASAQPAFVQPTMQSMYGQSAPLPPPSSLLQSTLATSLPAQPSAMQPRTIPAAQSLPARLVTPASSPEQAELDAISGLMREGRYEEATVKWLQSHQQVNIFNKLFVFVTPTYLQAVSALVVLSVAATIASTFESHVAERLQWLEYCFTYLNTRDPDIRELIPRIMEVLIERLEALYVEIAKENLHDPVLSKIPNLTTRARQLQQSVELGR